MKKLALLFFVFHFSFFIFHSVSAQWGCACLPEGISFSAQGEIDNFQDNYPGCTVIEGNVTISGWGILNLSGLSVLTSIGGDLHIGQYFVGNPSLTSLSGLNNLTSIGGHLQIRNNNSLTSLTGLDNLTSIGDYLIIFENISLTSLTGLDNLNSIGDYLSIYYNDSLTGLTGLDNLTSIGGGLNIEGNPMLSYCEIEAICDYLENPNGNIYINSNAPGCDSEEEVEAACVVGIGQLDNWTVGQPVVSVYPNPTNGTTQFLISNFQQVTLKIYDVHGREVATVLDGNLAAGEHVVQWDASGLPAGVYFYRFAVGGQRSAVSGKIMKF